MKEGVVLLQQRNATSKKLQKPRLLLISKAPHKLLPASLSLHFRANSFPEVTNLSCRLPLSTLFYRPEASNLGDLRRLSVRPNANVLINYYQFFTNQPLMTKYNTKMTVLLNDLGHISDQVHSTVLSKGIILKRKENSFLSNGKHY